MASVPRIGDIPQQLSPKEFWDLFGHLDHARLDFKRGVPADIRDTNAAMAMTHGGLIVHGVDDQRALVGCPLSQNTQDRITRIATECGVDVQLGRIAAPRLLSMGGGPDYETCRRHANKGLLCPDDNT